MLLFSVGCFRMILKKDDCGDNEYFRRSATTSWHHDSHLSITSLCLVPHPYFVAHYFFSPLWEQLCFLSLSQSDWSRLTTSIEIVPTFLSSLRAKVIYSKEAQCKHRSSQNWHRVAVSLLRFLFETLCICILECAWIVFDFRWMRQQSVKLFQPTPFHASFHTIILSQFDCQGKHNSQNCNFLMNPRVLESEMSFIRQQIHIPNCPEGLCLCTSENRTFLKGSFFGEKVPRSGSIYRRKKCQMIKWIKVLSYYVLSDSWGSLSGA